MCSLKAANLIHWKCNKSLKNIKKTPLRNLHLSAEQSFPNLIQILKKRLQTWQCWDKTRGACCSGGSGSLSWAANLDIWLSCKKGRDWARWKCTESFKNMQKQSSEVFIWPPEPSQFEKAPDRQGVPAVAVTKTLRNASEQACKKERITESRHLQFFLPLLASCCPLQPYLYLWPAFCPGECAAAAAAPPVSHCCFCCCLFSYCCSTLYLFHTAVSAALISVCCCSTLYLFLLLF